MHNRESVRQVEIKLADYGTQCFPKLLDLAAAEAVLPAMIASCCKRRQNSIVVQGVKDSLEDTPSSRDSM